MKEKTTIGQVIIVFTEHPVLGALLIPYIAEKRDDATVHLIEQAFHASNEAMASMYDAERQAIEIASHYTEKYLMGVYSREKTVSHFLRKLSEDPDRLKNNIRPFIEKKLLEMLEVIRKNNLPFYQKPAGSKILYAHHAYHIHPDDVEIRFTFHMDEKIFRYQLQCFYKGQPFSLSEQKPVIVLTSSPSTLLLGMELYFFPHIESTRILPFTKKRSISVDISQVEKYIDNIVIPIARYHDITTHGLDIIEEKYHCQAALILEDTVYDEQLLKLNFHYGDQSFAPDFNNEIKKIVYRKKSGEIVFFQRHTASEKRALQLLTRSGLQQISDVHFKLSPNSVEKTITEWIYQNREMLQHSFLLTSNRKNTSYCLNELRIEQSCDDEPDWFELHINVIIGTMKIPFARFRKHILEERKEFLLPNGQIFLIPDEWFSKYGNLMEMGIQTEKGIRLKHTFIGAVQSALDENGLKKFPNKSQVINIPVPDGLKAQLRPYQQKGFSWMLQLYEQGFGGCLADDMGLGKTLQTLTLLQHIYKPLISDTNIPETVSIPTLPVEKEEPISDSTGQFSLFAFNTEDELLPDACEIRKKKITITDPRPRKKETPRKPATLIVVPTSLLHNWHREAKRFTTLSMAEYNSTTVISKEHPERFFGHFHLIFTTYGMMRNNIDILRSYCFEYIVLDESQNIKNSDSLTFRSTIQLQGKHRLVLTGTPIENSLKDLWAQFRFLQPDLLGEENIFHKQFIVPIRQGNTRLEGRLQQLISPFILRRNKKEVAPELPPLTEETIYCEMTEEQHSCYELEKNSLRNILLRQSHHTDRLHSFSILNGILRLRQLSCHPHLVFPDFNGISGKMEQIIETFDTLQSEGHKVLIFSSFVQHLELIAEVFQQRNWKYALLTGSTNNRPSEIAHFTDQKDVQAFLISLKAGGVGLNLTEADYVFIIDPWWNPAAEAQAIARAHRIGQDKQVIAYRFITQNSIEEKILHLQAEKRKLAETFITDSDDLPVLTSKEWADLL
ncbi:DEAD/DEAH box helicase [Bacteroides sp.]|uniref:DEAD/DEAH box helicase n=1 Tax=Bacteroides sp. TaxID=29523 RepID=UPI00262ECEB3|nr:DEAD/DEAH box helicase [Bacteroides sp.]MDD3036364.1 DEAD/DEAH box helicase [Bacteroides sp.]